MGIQPALIIEKIVTDSPGIDFVATLDGGGSIVVLTPMRGKDSADRISVKTLEFDRSELEAILDLLGETDSVEEAKVKIAVTTFVWPFALSSTEMAAWGSVSPRMREYLSQSIERE